MRERLNSWATYFAGVGIALWVATAILYVLGNQPNERLIALAVLGAIGIALYVYARPSDVRDALSSRSLRLGSNALIATIAFIGIVGIINYLGSRYSQQWDLTAGQSFTLSPLTINMLQGLKEPVVAIGLYAPESPNRQSAEDRLRDYAHYSDKFTYKMIDPIANPEIGAEYKLNDAIVLERGKRRENVFTVDEQTLTNALLKVSQDTQPVVYFTIGHGEHGLADNDINGYSQINQILQAFNYQTQSINLKTITDTLPSDMSVLVIAGPRQPFESAEVKMLQDYVTNKSGRVLILLNPQSDTGLDAFIKGLGVTVRNDLAIDQKLGFYGRAQIPVINEFQPHAITKDLNGVDLIIPGARSLIADPTSVPTRTVTALFATSDISWGETDFEALKQQKVQFDSPADTRGPLNLAYTIELSGEKPARVVVLGNATFTANGNLAQLFQVGGGADSGNIFLFRNMVNWLAGQENLIAIPAKSQNQQNPIILTAEQDAFVKLSSVVLLPIAIVLVGVLVWIRRR